MSKLKIECVTYDNGSIRRLLQIKETGDGTVIIKNNTGMQVGLPPNNRVISEHRYSIHPSLNNTLPYSTIKNHLIFEDQSFLPPTYQLTDALKSVNGFTSIFTVRYSDLKTPRNDLKKLKSGFTLVDVGRFDSSKHCLHLSLYVGHPDAPFQVANPYKKTEIKSKYVKLVILVGLIPLPAIPFTYIYNRVTHGDDVFGPDNKGIPEQYKSSSVEECLHHLNHLLIALVNRYSEELETLKSYG